MISFLSLLQYYLFHTNWSFDPLSPVYRPSRQSPTAACFQDVRPGRRYHLGSKGGKLHFLHFGTTPPTHPHRGPRESPVARRRKYDPHVGSARVQLISFGQTQGVRFCSQSEFRSDLSGARPPHSPSDPVRQLQIFLFDFNGSPVHIT